MTKAEFRALVDAAKARYDAMSPSDKLRHDYMQRRSFVRGMCPSARDYEEWCDRVDDTMPHESELTDTEIGLALLNHSAVSTSGSRDNG
jgi:hypothetical protein